MMKNEKGRLFIISGPSGAGKSTVIGKAMGLRNDLCFSVSVTTRAPREGEIDGIHYFFVSLEYFSEMIEKRLLLEHAQYVGNYYGTPLEYVNSKLGEGVNVLLDIEVQGAAQVKARMPDATSIFIIPSAADQLELRLRGRNTDAEERIKSRLEQARIECAEAGRYDYIVINDDPAQAAREIDAIITAEHCKASARIKYVTEVLKL